MAGKTWFQRWIWDSTGTEPSNRFGSFWRYWWTNGGLFKRTLVLIMIFFVVNLTATFCCCGCFSVVGFFMNEGIPDEQKFRNRPQDEDKHKQDDKDGKDGKIDPKINPPIPPDRKNKRFEEEFELPDKDGEERKLELNVVVTAWGKMTYKKEANQHFFSGEGGEPIFLVKNNGKEAVQLGVAAAEEDGDLRNKSLQLEPGGAYQLKLYPWMGRQNWTCVLWVQKVKK